MAKYLTSGSILMLALASPAVAAPSPTLEKPRLVLQTTVDQLRGDLPTHYFDRLGKGGLRYLLEEGIHYNNAHHAHANTETIVGHVTIIGSIGIPLAMLLTFAQPAPMLRSPILLPPNGQPLTCRS